MNNDTEKDLVALMDDQADIERHKVELEAADEKKKIEDDYEYARSKIKSILNDSEEVLEHAKDIAIETGEPRAIEAYNSLMKNMSTMASDVMKNAVEKSKAEKNRKVIQSNYDPDSQNMIGNIGNNKNNDSSAAIFVGSTKDLLKMVQAEEDKSRSTSLDDIDHKTSKG